jgi:hypothetical protein
MMLGLVTRGSGNLELMLVRYLYISCAIPIKHVPTTQPRPTE